MSKSLVCLALLVPLAVVAGEAPLPAVIEFNRDVRPILSDNCFYCHGPDKNHRKGDLRLDVREDAVAAAAILPGKVEESELIARIETGDGDDLMPPPDSHKTLTNRQKDILRNWILQGAAYQQHWAYEKPVKASIPTGANGVDVLVRKRLAEIGLKPWPRASPRTLVRRLSSDLLGLPPAPEEVAAFAADSSPGAYDKLVDRMLQNPHFGERMALGWLDVVRFADTIGYHSDNPRNIWPYRDWVIAAFNANKPFDRFTLEQIAGDLLPDSDRDAKVGSAFNRLLLTTEEGGAQAKDYEQRMLADRVRAIGTAWIGQTTGCCQCHDHKFDPWTMRDFYSMGAFFADIKEPILGKREDGMIVATPEEEKKLGQLDAALASTRKQLAAVEPQLQAAQQQWEHDVITYGVTLPELAKDSKASDAEKKSAQRVIASLKRPDKERDAKQKEALKDYYRKQVTRLFPVERDALAKAERERNALYDRLPKCIVSVSDSQQRTVRILPRGNWMDESGEIVKPALPGYLPKPTIEGRELTRLDLAHWLVSRENPLTARTVMNRLWKQFFGTGISKMLDDLGAQGEPPVNPALLDWLACEFMDSGWDLKHMVRLIVTSETYRQASSLADCGFQNAVPPVTQSEIASLQSAIERDPYNRECARQSPFRLDAELVRDNALAISGLLVPKIGGPSVKPYQPERYWENLNFPPREWQADTGEGLYRRGLYVWWQRTFLHPSLLAFDAPSREECVADRNRSNLPQQALVLLNDPTYVEAARVFAARILAQCKGDASQRITWAFQHALQRNPDEAERKTLTELLARQLADYTKDAAAGEALLKTGQSPVPADLSKSELAAWTHLARVLLNLHETITRA